MAKTIEVTGSKMDRIAEEETERTEAPRPLYEDNQLLHVPLDRIRPNPEQPRMTFAEDALRELADSIRDRGVLQPVIVTPDPDDAERFILVAGERRWRASQLAGRETIPTIFRRDIDLLEIAIVENLQRENLNPVEEAEGLQRLKERHAYTDDKLARVLGKSRVSVTELLAISSLPDGIKKECRTSDIGSKSALLSLARATDDGQRQRIWEAIKKGHSVRELDGIRGRRAASRPSAAKPRKIFRTDCDAIVIVQSTNTDGLSRQRTIAALECALRNAEADDALVVH